MLFICSWRWGKKWAPHYAERLFAGVKRNLCSCVRPYISVLATDQPETCGADIVVPIDDLERPFAVHPGCLGRLRMFDRVWQERLGAVKGDHIVCMDLDSVIVGDLIRLFAGNDEFRIMQDFNTTNPCPFNGSLWMFRAGERHDVWDDFNVDAYAARNVPVHAIPDDQGWLHHKFPDAKAYTPDDGVYAFKKRGWLGGEKWALPANARIVVFPGRSPEKYQALDWVREHWR